MSEIQQTSEQNGQLSVFDVIKTDAFYNTLCKMLDKIKMERWDCESVWFPHCRTIDELIDKNIFLPTRFRLLCVEILNKKAKGFSRRERTFVLAVCGIAYSDAVESLSRVNNVIKLYI